MTPAGGAPGGLPEARPMRPPSPRPGLWTQEQLPCELCLFPVPHEQAPGGQGCARLPGLRVLEEGSQLRTPLAVGRVQGHDGPRGWSPPRIGHSPLTPRIRPGAGRWDLQVHQLWRSGRRRPTRAPTGRPECGR